MKLISIGALALLLGGCGYLNPVSPAQVAATEESYTIVARLATNYLNLPPCPTTSKVCSDPQLKTRIKGYDQRAYDAVKALKASSVAGAPAALSAAEAALAALQAVVPAMPATN